MQFYQIQCMLFPNMILKFYFTLYSTLWMKMLSNEPILILTMPFIFYKLPLYAFTFVYIPLSIVTECEDHFVSSFQSSIHWFSHSLFLSISLQYITPILPVSLLWEHYQAFVRPSACIPLGSLPPFFTYYLFVLVLSSQ